MKNLKDISSTIALKHFFIVVLNIFTCSLALANEQEPSASGATTIDSILGALADLSVEQASNILSLTFTRDLREKVCRYQIYTTNKMENDGFTDVLFSNTCDYVRDKIERNAISRELVDAFKKDLIINSLILATATEILGDASDLTVEKWTQLRKEYDVSKTEWSKKHKVVANMFMLAWSGKEVERIAYEFLNDYDDLKDYVPVVQRAQSIIETLEMLENKDHRMRYKEFSFINESGRLMIVYPVVKSVEGGLEVVSQKVDLNLKVADQLDEELIKYILEAINDKGNKKENLRKIAVQYLEKNGCTTESCRQKITLLSDNKPRKVLLMLSERLAEKNKECVGELECDTDNLNRKDFKAIQTVGALVELSNIQSIDEGKAIMSTYLADSNTRTAKYWEDSFSIGTLIGFSAGRSYCPSCSDVNALIEPNLFMPLGFFWTRGYFGAQLHLVDLGQYTNFDKENTKDSTDVKYGVAPGISFIFARFRRYPVAFGIDYTFLPENDARETAHEFKLFAALDIPLFMLN